MTLLTLSPVAAGKWPLKACVLKLLDLSHLVYHKAEAAPRTCCVLVLNTERNGLEETCSKGHEWVVSGLRTALLKCASDQLPSPTRRHWDRFEIHAQDLAVTPVK